jgi:hypothetical protein
MPLEISTMQTHFETAHNEDLANGIYFGLIFCPDPLLSFVFISIRDTTYLYYGILYRVCGQPLHG